MRDEKDVDKKGIGTAYNKISDKFGLWDLIFNYLANYVIIYSTKVVKILL